MTVSIALWQIEFKARRFRGLLERFQEGLSDEPFQRDLFRWIFSGRFFQNILSGRFFQKTLFKRESFGKIKKIKKINLNLNKIKNFGIPFCAGSLATRQAAYKRRLITNYSRSNLGPNRRLTASNGVSELLPIALSLKNCEAEGFAG